MCGYHIPLFPIRPGSILLITVKIGKAWGPRVSLYHVGSPCQPAPRGVPMLAITKCSFLALACHSIPEKNHPCFADQKLGLGEGVVPVRGGLTVSEGQSQGFVPGVSTCTV